MSGTPRTTPRARLIAFTAAVVMLLVGATTASADTPWSQLNTDMVLLNPGGGMLADGSDGAQFAINADPGYVPGDTNFNWRSEPGADQMWFGGRQAWNQAGPAPGLYIGGTMANGGRIIGNGGAAAWWGTNQSEGMSWDALKIVSLSGSAVQVPTIPNGGTYTSTTTGDAKAVLKYTVTKGGLVYEILRTVTYTYPNRFVTDRYEFTLPQGSEAVQFYTGGDGAPGSQDYSNTFGLGPGFDATPTSALYSTSANTPTPGQDMYFAWEQAEGSSSVFDGAWGGALGNLTSQVQPSVWSGQNIPFAANQNLVDSALFMNWNIGSTPGTHTRTMTSRMGFRGVEASITATPSTAVVGEHVPLTIALINTDTKTSSFGFSQPLPVGLKVAGAATSTCAGTVTAAVGAEAINLAGGSLAKFTRCAITVPVTADHAGTYIVKQDEMWRRGAIGSGFEMASIAFTAAPAKATTDGASATTAKTNAPLTIAKASGSSTTISTTVRVTGAGRAVMTGTVAGKSAFAPKAQSFTKAGAATIRAALNARTRALLRTRDVRVRITVRFIAADGRTTTSTRTVLLKKIQVRPEPVTG